MCFVFKGIYIDPWRIYTAPILGWRVTHQPMRSIVFFSLFAVPPGNALIPRAQQTGERPAQRRRSLLGGAFSRGLQSSVFL